MGLAAGAFGGAVAFGMGKAIAANTAFSKEMSAVAAAAGASRAELDLLRESAIKAGAATSFSAGEAAQGQVELAKAGVATADILGGGLAGALDLAAAGQIGVAESAEIAATAMTQFRLGGDEVSHVADLLASGANKAQGGVGDLGAALNQSGLVASQFGLSLEETVGTLSAFAKAGMIGSDAGTAARTMLLRLANPTEEVKALLAELNINAYDAQGNFVGMASLAGQLQDSLGGLTQAERDQSMAMIFGQDAIRASSILMAEGEQGIRDWTAAVDDQGAASRNAETLLDNLAGSLEQFSGSVETAMIEFGEEADGALRSVVDFGTGVVNGLAQLPDSVQGATMAFGGLTGGLSLAAGGFMVATPHILSMKDGLARMATEMPRAHKALSTFGSALTGPVGIALGVASAGLLLYAHRKGEATARTEEFVATLDEETGALTGESRALAVNSLQKEGAYNIARRMGLSLRDVTDAVLGDEAAMERVTAATIAYQRAGQGSSVEAQQRAVDVGVLTEVVGQQAKVVEDAAVSWATHREAMGVTSGAVGGMTGALERMAPAQDALAQGSQAVADGMNGLGPSIETVGEELEEAASAGELMQESLEGLYGATINADRAAIDYEANLDSLRKTLRENGTTLDKDTAKGRENLAAVIDLAEGSHALVQAKADEGKGVGRLRAIYDNHRKDLRQTLEQAGLLPPQIRELIEQYGLTPKQVNTTLNALGVEDAVGGINRVKDAVDGLGETVREINGEMRVRVDGGWSRGIARNMGGRIPGSGPDRDSVLIHGTPGEYVHTRRAVDYYGLPFMEGLNQRRIPRGALGLNAGGSVTFASSSSMSSEAMPQMSNIVALGRYLQSQGFRVGEHPAFGGVGPGHDPDGYHYDARAIDANYGPPGASAVERGMIARYLPSVVGMAGGRIVENLHPFNDPSHGDHWHLAMNAGGRVGELPSHPAQFNKGGAVYNPKRVKRIIGRANAIGTVEAYADAVAQVEDLARAWDEVIRKQEVAARKQELVNAISKAERVRDRVLDDPKATGKEQRQARRDYREAQDALEEFLAAERQGDAERRVARQTDRLEARAARAEEREARRAARAEERAEARARRAENIATWDFSQMTTEKQLENVQRRLKAQRRGSGEWLRLMNDQQRLTEQIAAAQEQAAADAARSAQELQEQAARHAAEVARDAAEALREAEEAQRELARAEQERLAERQRLVDDAVSVFTRNQDALNAWFNPGSRQTVDWGNSIEAEVENFRSQISMYEQWQDALASVRSAGLSDAAISMRGLDAGPQTLGQLRQFANASAEQLAEYNQLVNRSSQLTAGTATQVAVTDPAITTLLQELLRGVQAGGDIYIDGQRAGQILAPYVTSTQQIDARMARVT